MNKDELIRLKEILLDWEKKYTSVLIDGNVDGQINVDPIDQYQPKSEILQPTNPTEEMVVDYFEGKLEEIIRNAVKQGVEFDGLKTTMFLRYFISQDMADKIDANCCLKQEDFDRNEVLNNIVEVFFGYYFINETKGQLDAEKYFNNPNEAYEKSFVVNYERFVNYLMSRGFDVDIPNFDVALEESLNGVEPTIIADLTKETKKTR